jgi:hypothetical protein
MLSTHERKILRKVYGPVGLYASGLQPGVCEDILKGTRKLLTGYVRLEKKYFVINIE